jgi:hypothetical protein
VNPDEPFCFLITPFGEDGRFHEVRRNGIDPAVMRFGFPTYRIDEVPTVDSIIDATRDHIALADFVVADLTGARPNCYYEIGYAHAIGRPVAHIIHVDEEPHFNVSVLQLIKYRNGKHLRQLLEQHLLTHVFTTQGGADDADPNKGAFGRRQFVDPYVLTARIRVDDSDDDDPSLTFVVDLKVRSVDPRQPLSGDVTFHLHPEIDEPVRKVRSVNGVAVLVGAESYGTYTVGVTVHKSGARLELDLDRAPGASTEFRNR